MKSYTAGERIDGSDDVLLCLGYFAVCICIFMQTAI
jgi:hypothetical protein